MSHHEVFLFGKMCVTLPHEDRLIEYRKGCGRMRISSILACCLCLFLLASCGQSLEGEQGNLAGEEKIMKNGLPIIAQLSPSTSPTATRDAKVEEIAAREDVQSGMFGKPIEKAVDSLAVQEIEGEAVDAAIQEVYGAIAKYGVIFSDSDEEGKSVWIGVKEPDERLDQLVSALQKKVDHGEILAERIVFFQCDKTQVEQYALMDEVGAVLQKQYGGKGSYSVTVNVVTNVVEITHDFLTEDQMNQIEKQFSKEVFSFEQEGRLVAGVGEQSITYSEETTETPFDEGEIIVAVDNQSILASSGSLTFYKTPEVPHKLEVGQRVQIEITGGVLESYPAQAGAKYIEVLPEYVPDNAKLTEREVVKKAIEMVGEPLAIQSIQYDAERDEWKIVFLNVEQEEIEITL